eukprot:2365027-Prymnesium_polylepis.2
MGTYRCPLRCAVVAGSFVASFRRWHTWRGTGRTPLTGGHSTPSPTGHMLFDVEFARAHPDCGERICESPQRQLLIPSNPGASGYTRHSVPVSDHIRKFYAMPTVVDAARLRPALPPPDAP